MVVNTFRTLFPKKAKIFLTFIKKLNEIRYINLEKNFYLFYDFLHFRLFL